MAKGKWFTDFEREVVRIGIHKGYKVPQIARFLKRDKKSTYNQTYAMRDAGTLDNLPMCFIIDEIAEAIGKA